MAESVLKRIKRIVSARIEDTVDAMERAGGTGIMRESIREAERAIDEAKKECDTVTVRRLQAVRQQKMFSERLAALTEKAEFALQQGRPDWAEAALSRQIDFEAQIERLHTVEAEAAEQERELQEAMAALEMRRSRMEEELKAFEAAREENGMCADTGMNKDRNRHRRMERAEAAFDRAMAGAGGSDMMPFDAETARSLAELDHMQKRDAVQSRLDALRSKMAG